MSKITFKCKLSGNTVSFVNPLDIECLRKDVNYEEVKNGNQTETESKSIGNRTDDEDEARNERKERNDENEVRQEEVLKKKAGRPKKK
jgi:hypothetical protein